MLGIFDWRKHSPGKEVGLVCQLDEVTQKGGTITLGTVLPGTAQTWQLILGNCLCWTKLAEPQAWGSS